MGGWVVISGLGEGAEWEAGLESVGLKKGWRGRLGCNQWAWRRGGGGGWVVISGLGEGVEGEAGL